MNTTTTQEKNRVLVVEVKNRIDGTVRTLHLNKKRILVGSSTAVDVRLNEEIVSPIHAIVEVNFSEDKITLYDMASESGVRVNDELVVQKDIKSSDQVQIGSFTLQFSSRNLEEITKETVLPVKEVLGEKVFLDPKEDLSPLILEDESKSIPIFDYSKEFKPTLQVVMFYYDTILDIEHFVEEKEIIIGAGKKDDFCIPTSLTKLSTSHKLVTFENGVYQVHLLSSMSGVVNLDGKLIRIEELLKGKSSFVFALNKNDFAKINFGNLSLFLSYSPAPPRLIPYYFKFQDTLFLKIFLLSLLLTGLLIYNFLNVPIDKTITIEQLPERVATIIYEPKNYEIKPKIQIQKPEVNKNVEEEKQKVIKITPTQTVTTKEPKNAMIGEKQNEKQNQKVGSQTQPKSNKPSVAKKASGSEGEGQKAKGVEGSRGKPDSKLAGTPQTKAVRPGEGKPLNHASQGKTNSETNDLGLVDVFKSGEGTLSKVLAGGKGVNQAADKLEGYSGFTTKGSGGLGAAGSGSGGGGESMGLGGLSNKGVGGGKKGTGLGALGSGGNLLGGTGKITIESGGGAGDPIVLGSIDTDAIARAIAQHKDEIKYCYEKEINAENPNLSGRVGVKFVIGPSGLVTSAGISSSTLNNANAERCIVAVIRRIQFPPVKGGGIAEVTYPFVFKPAKQ